MNSPSDPSLHIEQIGGNCPVQAEGAIDGEPFYFRARGEHWSFSVGAEPVGQPHWSWRQRYPGDRYAAGWMSEEEARAFIAQAAAQYRAFRRIANG